MEQKSTIATIIKLLECAATFYKKDKEVFINYYAKQSSKSVRLMAYQSPDAAVLTVIYPGCNTAFISKGDGTIKIMPLD